jgi:hypothetical protein
MKTVIQVYKPSDWWQNSPPGWGDFIRGTCHLHEYLNLHGIALKIDISQTQYKQFITTESEIFNAGTADQIKSAGEFFHDWAPLIERLEAFMQHICKLIESQVLNSTRLPIVLTGDCYALNEAFSHKYGFIWSESVSQYGGFNSSDLSPIILDLSLLKNSQHNYHINAWRSWWSGFCNYTSIIFEQPSTNFIYPYFTREMVDATRGFSKRHSLFSIRCSIKSILKRYARMAKIKRP